MSKMKKILALVLALMMLVSVLAGCNNADDEKKPADDNPPVDNNPPADDENNPPEDENPPEDVTPEAYTGPDWEAISAMSHDDASWELYEYVLGDYYEAYEAAKAETENLDLRMALMAIAEAKLLESGAFLPNTTNGGRYQMTRLVPRTVSPVLWGLDTYRYHRALVTKELITAEDLAALLEIYGQCATADEYLTKAKEFLAEHNYTLDNTYRSTFTQGPQTWDVIATSQTEDSEYIAGTYDGLMEYDAKIGQQYGLAESYEVSDDGTVYTFHIRKGVKWVDQQGREIGEVTADDWVASMAHLIDNNDQLGYLMTDQGCNIKNYVKYINGEVTDFAEVGVKAIDDYTLEYTLEAPFSPFLTMLGYGCFAPLNRDFYKSQGGTFSVDGDTYTSGNYGTSPETIAYCGPFLVTNFTEGTVLHYETNPTYWNKDAITVTAINYAFNDGSDTTRTWEDAKSGEMIGCSFTNEILTMAKDEIVEGTDKSYFDTYARVSNTDGTTFCGFYNLKRLHWTNYNNESIGVSPQTEEDHTRTRDALANQHFRLALSFGLDRGAYNAVRNGEELKYNNVRNSYVPGNFQYLGSDVTVDINGTPTTFTTGTAYGAITQAQLDADGVPIKVYDAANDTSDGFDGWYNVDNAKAELDLAIAELAQIGVVIDAEHPIQIDYPMASFSSPMAQEAQVYKQSIEATFGGLVVVNLLDFQDVNSYYDCGYRLNDGQNNNYDVYLGSGWGPDYGDAQTYMDTMYPYGYMTKTLGLWGSPDTTEE